MVVIYMKYKNKPNFKIDKWKIRNSLIIQEDIYPLII